MEFSASRLPDWLKLDPHTGEITGTLQDKGDYLITIRARNRRGSAKRMFRVVAGEKLALTPAMGWSSWNCWGGKVTAEKVLQSAAALAQSGLIDHGWTVHKH